MAELERLGPNPFALNLEEKGRCMANNAEAFSGQCTREFRLAFFFDGTNNNKDRDAPKHAHSNVARLHDIFEITPDQQRIYIPGIGTPFENEIGDTGRGYDARAGLMAGWGGEARINWALLKLTDAVYKLYYGEDLSKAMGSDDLKVLRKISADLSFPVHKRMEAAARDEAQKIKDEAEQLNEAGTGRTLAGALDTADNIPNPIPRRQELKRRRDFLSQKLKPLIADRKPKLQRIRLYVFGFSRGAAEARVFSSWLEDALDPGMTLAGVEVSFDFLGIFDTVASVGFAQSSMFSTGHGGWGQEEFLRVPKYVNRTVHLISSHEIRGSFPLDKAVAKDLLEIAYPGVHTDVGGAYQPGDQGRGCRADGTPDDSTKLSQVTLAKMYREAVAAGVPLKPSGNLPPRVLDALKISPQLMKDYNAYVDAVNPLIKKKGGGTTGAAHVQYGLYLRWRRLRLGSGADAFENQPFFKRAQNYSAQCAQDLSGANEELREEAKTMSEMENSILCSDGWMAAVFRRTGLAAEALVRLHRAIWGDKVTQWREVKAYWNDTSPLDPRIVKFFDDYVHDSRAWFKPMGATNEGVWKLREKARLEELKRKDAEWNARWKAEWQKMSADLQRDPRGTIERYAPVSDGGKGEVAPPPPPVMGQDRIDLDRYLKDGTLPLEKTGREFSSVWGYLRWRTHFAPELTLGERAQAAWDRVAAVPGKVADKVSQKVGEVAHSAEESLASTARKLLSAGQGALERGAKDVLEKYSGGGVPML